MIEKLSVDVLNPYDPNANKMYHSSEEIDDLIIEISAINSHGSILVATISLNNGMKNSTEQFPNTFEGFWTACGWLDGMRVKYRRNLL